MDSTKWFLDYDQTTKYRNNLSNQIEQSEA